MLQFGECSDVHAAAPGSVAIMPVQVVGAYGVAPWSRLVSPTINIQFEQFVHLDCGQHFPFTISPSFHRANVFPPIFTITSLARHLRIWRP